MQNSGTRKQEPLSFVTQGSAFKDKLSEELNIIIKTDVHGSSEAIRMRYTKLNFVVHQKYFIRYW